MEALAEKPSLILSDTHLGELTLEAEDNTCAEPLLILMDIGTVFCLGSVVGLPSIPPLPP